MHLGGQAYSQADTTRCCVLLQETYNPYAHNDRKCQIAPARTKKGGNFSAADSCNRSQNTLTVCTSGSAVCCQTYRPRSSAHYQPVGTAAAEPQLTNTVQREQTTPIRTPHTACPSQQPWHKHIQYSWSATPTKPHTDHDARPAKPARMSVVCLHAKGSALAKPLQELKQIILTEYAGCP